VKIQFPGSHGHLTSFPLIISVRTCEDEDPCDYTRHKMRTLAANAKICKWTKKYTQDLPTLVTLFFAEFCVHEHGGDSEYLFHKEVINSSSVYFLLYTTSCTEEVCDQGDDTGVTGAFQVRTSVYIFAWTNLLTLMSRNHSVKYEIFNTYNRFWATTTQVIIRQLMLGTNSVSRMFLVKRWTQ
jgi:hypothetical protein